MAFAPDRLAVPSLRLTTISHRVSPSQHQATRFLISDHLQAILIGRTSCQRPFRNVGSARAGRNER